MTKIIWTFGIISGVILGGMLAFSSFDGSMDFDTLQVIGYLTMIISFSTIFIGIKSHRDKNLKGFISFGKAFKIGLGITFIASTFYVGSWMIISSDGSEEFMEQYKEHMIEKAKDEGTSQEEINDIIVEMDDWAEMYKNPLVKVSITYMEVLPVGLIISLISAGILKKSNKE